MDQGAGAPVRHERLRMVLGGVLVLVMTAVPAAAQVPQARQHVDLPEAMPGDRILVQQRTPEGMELATGGIDGGDHTVLTSGHSDFAPAWSPDGRHVAFLRVEVPTDGLWLVSADGADGGGARRLADRGHSPSWAPDSARLVFSPSTEAAPEPLRVATLDGSTVPIPGTDGGIDPVWSPDGSVIAYVEPQRDYALVLVRPDGSLRTVVGTGAAEPTWSPDSLSVAYVQRTEAGQLLLRSDSAGSEVYLVTDRMSSIQQLAYSPAGDRIAFAGVQGDSNLDIWTARVADGELQRLTTDPAAEFAPAWSASARSVAFTRSEDLFAASPPTDVWVVPAGDTSMGPARRITTTGSSHVAAVALSRTFPTASTAVLARADDPADALAGAPLAALLDAPLLLTSASGLSPGVAAELARLGTDHAYVLGGAGALSEQIERDLDAAGISAITRLPGASRFATAAMVAGELRDLTGAALERVFVVEGLHADPARGWPDALSASGLAALAGEPVLLATRDVLPAITADSLRDLDARQVVIVGGPFAVSAQVQAELEALVDDVVRVAGRDRYETSALVADLAVSAGADAGHPWLATGRDWPDALAAVPAATHDGGVLLLIDGHVPGGSRATHAWLADSEVRRGVVVGGPGAIRPAARAAIEASMLDD